MSRTSTFIGLVAAIAFAAWAGSLPAQDFPARNITIIVPYPPGGSTDVAARVVGEHMAMTLGRHVVVENISGGGSTIATGRVARAQPDGYTLLVHQLALAANVSLFSKLSFDAQKDLSGIGLINYSPMMLVGRKSLSANGMSDLLSWMKGQRARFAHVGPGSAAHLCAALLAQAAGVEIDLVPYRGGGLAIPDLLAGHVDLYCTPPAGVGEYVKAGTAKGYGVAAKRRLDAFPDVPSLVESGFSSLDMRFWQGMFAPAGTPRPVVEKLNAALRLALADPAVIKSFAQTEFSVFPEDEQTPAAADRLLRAEIARWGEIIRANNVEPVQQ
jgi:tripartite-type tricarboxylate transporter receptor subunit TctC